MDDVRKSGPLSTLLSLLAAIILAFAVFAILIAVNAAAGRRRAPPPKEGSAGTTLRLPVPEDGRIFLGKNLPLEEEQGIEYSKDDQGTLKADGQHNAGPLTVPDDRYGPLLKPGERAMLYRKLSEPRRQVVELFGKTHDDVDRTLVANLADDGLTLVDEKRTAKGIAYIFKDPDEATMHLGKGTKPEP